MSENPVYPFKPAPILGPGWRYDATGRAFYSELWLQAVECVPTGQTVWLADPEYQASQAGKSLSEEDEIVD